jgi:hypothetical protein
MLQEAISAVEHDLIAQMHAVKLNEHESHTRLIMALQLSQTVNKHLWLTIQDGELADAELDVTRID